RTGGESAAQPRRCCTSTWGSPRSTRASRDSCADAPVASLRRLHRELAVDDLLERRRRLGAHELPAVDEEGRRAGDAELGAYADVAAPLRLVLAAVETVPEDGGVEVEILGVLLQLRGGLARGLLEEEIVVFPELPLLRRAPRRLVRLGRRGM